MNKKYELIEKGFEDMTTAEKIFRELSKPEYKLCFKGWNEGDDVGNYIQKLERGSVSFKANKERIEKAFPNITEGCEVYRMAVWNNGMKHFSNKPTSSQGVVVYYENNTDFVYLIMVSGNVASLCATERRYYGYPDLKGEIYTFSI